MKIPIGSPFSTSERACTITLVGGPYNGSSGLFDHARYDLIVFSATKTSNQIDYRKIRDDYPVYVFDKEWTKVRAAQEEQ